MKDEGKLNSDTKEKKTGIIKQVIHKKRSGKRQWVLLIILVVGLVAFVAANNDTFRLSMFSSVTNPSCRMLVNSSGNSGLTPGLSMYDSRCYPLTKEQQDQKRWQDMIQASPVVLAASSAVAALALIILTWQVSKLVKILGKRK
jgi:hypothetical protein